MILNLIIISNNYFKKKKKYLLTLKKDKISTVIDNESKIIKFDKEPNKINEDIYKKIMAITNYDIFINLYNEIKLRDIYVSYEIINSVNEIIGKSQLSDKIPALLERSCCTRCK